MIRITGGEFRGRGLATPADERTRPTQAKLRQALFNSLARDVPDALVLDLFAGSGALGFEALSRGAARVVFVEESRVAARLIERNAAELGVGDRIRLFTQPVEQAWAQLGAHGPFDVVFADPPYAAGWELRLLGLGDAPCPVAGLLAPDGVFSLEWGTQKSRVAELPGHAGPLVKTREKNYGDSVLSTYRLPES